MGRVYDRTVSGVSDPAIYNKYFPLPWKDHIMDILQTVQPEMVTGYIGYFILGHYLSHYEVSRNWNIWFMYWGNIDFGSDRLVLHQLTEIRKTNTVIL